MLVVQGGPGTGKTVVALHRAAYLLYTHRFPLEDQGVLVIGPNRVFLRYIERVLPSLGEAGVEQVVLADLVPDVRWARPGDHGDSELAARVKGDARMSAVIDKAVADRERPLAGRPPGAVPHRVRAAHRRRLGAHRQGRPAPLPAPQRRAALRRGRGVRRAGGLVARRAGDRQRGAPGPPRSCPRSAPRSSGCGRCSRRPSCSTTCSARRPCCASPAPAQLTEAEIDALHRPRAERVDDVRWTPADVALLDDAREVLGPRAGKGGKVDDADEIRTYGHIVVDEVQDLTPMQLKMAARRSLNGSLTVVGDLAQATGALAPDSWDDVLAHLPERKPARVVGLSVGYRIPAQIMELADRVMHAATPQLRSPRAVRVGDARPSIVRAPSAAELGAAAAEATAKMTAELTSGNVAVIVPDALVEEISGALTAAGIEHGRATRTGLDDPVTVVPVSVVKGLELDGVVVVEPARIVSDEVQGLRALYVALTRPTQRLTVVHAADLPAAMRPASVEAVPERGERGSAPGRVLQHPPVAEPVEHGDTRPEPLG